MNARVDDTPVLHFLPVPREHQVYGAPPCIREQSKNGKWRKVWIEPKARRADLKGMSTCPELEIQEEYTQRGAIL